MACPGPLNPLMDEAAAGVARGEHSARLIERLGIGRRTLTRWKGREGFRRRVAELRSEMIGKAMGRAVEAASDGATALRRLLNSPNEGIVLGAARALLQLSGHLYEAIELRRDLDEIICRLDRVEAGRNGQLGRCGRLK